MNKQTTIIIHKGIIKDFYGSWGSGLGTLVINDIKDGRVEISCDNAPTVRALEDAFGNVITDGHTVGDGYKNQEIFYCYDDMGLCLDGFLPVSLASRELKEKYKSQFKIKRKKVKK